MPEEVTLVEVNLVDDWRAVGRHIGKHIKPSQLDFSFTCDCPGDDTETARLVLDILLEHFTGPLKECSIRLEPFSGEALQSLIPRFKTNAEIGRAHV